MCIRDSINFVGGNEMARKYFAERLKEEVGKTLAEDEIISLSEIYDFFECVTGGTAEGISARNKALEQKFRFSYSSAYDTIRCV